MLATPDFENAVNETAVELIRFAPDAYMKVVAECVRNSKELKDDSKLKQQSEVGTRY